MNIDEWAVEGKKPAAPGKPEPSGPKRNVLKGTQVHRQCQLPTGQWFTISKRPATPEEMTPATEQATPEPAIKSGSHNSHARLAPSASKQWTQCTGSIAFTEANRHRVPEDRGSKWAQAGTDAHDWAAKVLTGAAAVEDLPDECREPVGAYVAHCDALTPEGVKPLIEVEVPLFYQTTSKGTCDFAVVTDERVVVRDYKHGEGVLVRSEGNTQLAIYALSLIRLLDFEHDFQPDTVCDLAVFQPRHREGHEQKLWVLSLAELEAFCNDIELRAIQAQVALDRCAGKIEGFGSRDVAAKEILEAAPGAKFEPGDGDDGACRWCACKAFCEVRLAACMEPAGAHVSDPASLIDALPDLTAEEKGLAPVERIEASLKGAAVDEPVTDEFLVALYRSWKRLKAFYSDVEEYLAQRAEAGNPAPGTKLVLSREGNREWADEDAADTFLAGQKLKKEERYTFKLKSPAQVEKILAPKLKSTARTRTRFESLITRSAAKPVLALDDDKREAVGSAVDALPDLTEEFEV